MDVRILGPLEVEVDGRKGRLGPQQRVLLAVLILEAGQVVPRSRLIELLWEELPPEGAASTLRSHVLHLRRVLEPSRAAGEDPKVLVADAAGEASGYALRIRPEELDAVRFEQMLEQGRRALADGDHQAATRMLRSALRLWRGHALADVANRSFALHEAARLESLRLAAREALIEAEMTSGRHAAIVGELMGLVADHPEHEGLRLQLALALYRCQRPEEAARICQEGLQLLVERGLDSPALEARQRDILQRAPDLEWSGPEPPRPFELPPDAAEFTGRDEERRALLAHLSAKGDELEPSVTIVAIIGTPGVGKPAATKRPES